MNMYIITKMGSVGIYSTMAMDETMRLESLPRGLLRTHIVKSKNEPESPQIYIQRNTRWLIELGTRLPPTRGTGLPLWLLSESGQPFCHQKKPIRWGGYNVREFFRVIGPDLRVGSLEFGVFT